MENQTLVNLLVGNWKANYQPGCYLTADEDICKFKGRHHLKQYLRAKIVKWGFKIWKLCDATFLILMFMVGKKVKIHHLMMLS